MGSKKRTPVKKSFRKPRRSSSGPFAIKGKAATPLPTPVEPEMIAIKFGTDGWRGRIAEEYTFENVRRCAQGFANYLKVRYPGRQLERGVVIGGDRRFNSEHFASAAAEVLAANDIPVHFCGGGVPTPVISFSVTNRKAIGAINITASHNPPTDNGFKVRDEFGGAIDPEGLTRIERLIPKNMGSVQGITFADALNQKRIRKFNPEDEYTRQISSLVDLQGLKDAGFRVLVDAMWGNGAGWFSKLLSGGATQVIEIHSDRNPSFPEMSRPEPIPPNVDVGLARGLEVGADVVLITDGDADRCGIGDERGRFIDQLRVYALLALYLLDIREERGAIVKTLSTTSMLDALGKLYNVPVYETGVGFKYVAPKMLETDALIGGEESGGYAFRGHVPERDGILANLYFLDFMAKTRLKPSQLLQRLFDKVGPHYYDRIDVVLLHETKKKSVLERLMKKQPAKIAGLDVIKANLMDGFKFILSDGSWLLIRFSGTEPLIRVYSEAGSMDRVKAILRDGRALVE